MRRRQAAKETWRHLLNLAVFAIDHHAGVPWSEAVSCEDEGGSSRQAALAGAQVGLGLAAQCDGTGCEAFASHDHFDWVVARRQSVDSYRNAVISHSGDFQLDAAGENHHIIRTAAEP